MVVKLQACSTREVLPLSVVETHPGETLVRVQQLVQKKMAAKVLASALVTPTVATAVVTTALDSAVAIMTEKIEAQEAASVATEAASAATEAVVVVALPAAIEAVVVAALPAAIEAAVAALAAVTEVAVEAVPLEAKIIQGLEDSEAQTLAESDPNLIKTYFIIINHNSCIINR